MTAEVLIAHQFEFSPSSTMCRECGQPPEHKVHLPVDPPYGDLKGRKNTVSVGVAEVRVAVNSPANQDATSILITRTDEDGKKFYVKRFVWAPYNGFDMLDISEVGTTAPVRLQNKERKT